MHVKLDEMVVLGDELLFKPLFLKANTTLSATVIPFLFLSLCFSIPILWGSFTSYSFLLDHLDRTLVNHLNFHLSICPIRHLLWLFVNSGGLRMHCSGTFST